MNSLKTKTLDIKLSAKNQRKFGLRVNLLTEYINKFLFHAISILVSYLFASCTIYAYFDPNTGYSLIITIFWSFMSILWAISFYSFTPILMCSWYFSTLFLKYKFNEINESIEMSVRTGNTNLLMHSIYSHNSVAKLTKYLNKFFSFFIFIMYYIGTPGGELICYISHEKSTILTMRCVAAFVFGGGISMMIVMTLLSANVIHSAHKSYPLLYTFLIENKLNLRDSLTIQSFIECLSGPDIGFYCLNMFPMNSYEFYEFVSISVSNYFLIMSIF